MKSCPLHVCKDFLKEKVQELGQELGQSAKQASLNLNSSTEVPAVGQDNGNQGSDSGLDSTHWNYNYKRNGARKIWKYYKTASSWNCKS